MTDPRDEARERDLIGQLSAAWQGLPTPPIGGELDKQDAATQRTVQWLAAAWTRLPVPPVRLPDRATAFRPRGTWRASWHTGWRPAAAALLLLALTLPLLLRRTAPGSARRGPIAKAPSPAAPARPAHPIGRLATASLIAEARPELALRSGPVRLLLVNPTNSKPSEDER
jgi:hypothetical protein